MSIVKIDYLGFPPANGGGRSIDGYFPTEKMSIPSCVGTLKDTLKEY